MLLRLLQVVKVPDHDIHVRGWTGQSRFHGLPDPGRCLEDSISIDLPEDSDWNG